MDGLCQTELGAQSMAEGLDLRRATYVRSIRRDRGAVFLVEQPAIRRLRLRAGRRPLRGGRRRGYGLLCQRGAGPSDRLYPDHGGLERPLGSVSRPAFLEEGPSFYGGYEFRWLYRTYAVFEATLVPAVVRTGRAADHPHALPARGCVRALFARLANVPALQADRRDTLPQSASAGRTA